MLSNPESLLAFPFAGDLKEASESQNQAKQNEVPSSDAVKEQSNGQAESSDGKEKDAAKSSDSFPAAAAVKEKLSSNGQQTVDEKDSSKSEKQYLSAEAVKEESSAGAAISLDDTFHFV